MAQEDTIDLSKISEKGLLSRKGEKLNKKDLDNIMTGLGAIYLKNITLNLLLSILLTKSRNDKFMKMISSDKFINELLAKIKKKVLSTYGDQFTEQDIDYQFESDLRDHKEVFLERVRIELDRQKK